MLHTPAMVCRIWSRLVAVMWRFYHKVFAGHVEGCTPFLRRLPSAPAPAATEGILPLWYGDREGFLAPRFELICPSGRGCDEGGKKGPAGRRGAVK